MRRSSLAVASTASFVGLSRNSPSASSTSTVSPCGSESARVRVGACVCERARVHCVCAHARACKTDLVVADARPGQTKRLHGMRQTPSYGMQCCAYVVQHQAGWHQQTTCDRREHDMHASTCKSRMHDNIQPTADNIPLRSRRFAGWTFHAGRCKLQLTRALCCMR